MREWDVGGALSMCCGVLDRPLSRTMTAVDWTTMMAVDWAVTQWGKPDLRAQFNASHFVNKANDGSPQE
jgi:hypothetical protein